MKPNNIMGKAVVNKIHLTGHA